ncbi:cytochrome b [Pararhodobacter oceanensis]|uniref:cytochrome b n=1 Tax=Pararhodobacter oceanensis TaxID=2172121 RepID=UPI003A959EF1
MPRYHPLLVALHWLLAVMILVALVMGGTVLKGTPNSDPTKVTALMQHMGAGIAILALMVIRLLVRLRSAKPPPADIGHTLLNMLGVAMHYALYLAVFAMGISGIVTANIAGLPEIVFFGADFPLPENFRDIQARAVHGVISKLLWLLIALHVAAGLYHQLVRKDGLFARMWFGRGA